ncbi:Protein ABSCISIC ACID-INSENSITIVE 5 [Triticum urartu]|uniref:Protein ABSCISIC ACID-INSENSITIVE 5 n=1 Tax=Triticum urartu TaxID=4572 RepID=M7ZAI1_TRIUA|nr:Protein ABSCISIC ACID-INSENSITIVE 5 [Triticum urartu]
MASEMSKDVKFSEEEVTSHPRVLEGEEQAVAPARQSSIFALTLDELQYSVAPVVGAGGGGGGLDAGGSNLARQESFSLPPPLCRKTVEEVWAEINREPRPVHAQPQAARPSQQPPVHPSVPANDRQGTLGELTLEQFLVKAGVVRGSGAGGQAPVPVGMVHGQMNPAQQGQQPGPMMYPIAPANGMFPVMGDGMGFIPNGYAGMVVVPPPPPPQGGVVGIVSPGSSDGRSAMTQADMMNCMGEGAMMENGGTRKRGASEDQSCERSIERRHRRMIKNRESAARSRARKQAYTVELEAELNHLKEENARLKAEEKTILLTKKQMLMKKMEQSKENVNAKKGDTLSRRYGDDGFVRNLRQME